MTIRKKKVPAMTGGKKNIPLAGARKPKKKRRVTPAATYPRIYLALDDLRCIRPFMADFFKVMRNHRVACLLTMQQEEQWDLLNLAPMKNVIRGLLSLKMFYRPETLETAEKMALLLKPYDAMGDVRPYATKSKGHTRTEGTSDSEGWARSESDTTGGGTSNGSSKGEQSGWQLAPRVDADGQVAYLDGFPALSGGNNTGYQSGDSSSWGASSSTTKSGATSRSQSASESNSESEQFHIVSAREQVFVDAQHLLSGDMERHDAVVRWETPDGRPQAAYVHVSPFPPPPEHRDGRPVLRQYRAAVARFARRSTRLPYVRGTLAVAVGLVTEPVKDDGATVVAEPATSGSVTTTSGTHKTKAPAIALFPPRAGDLVEREMRTIYTLEAVANVHLCTVQILMLLFRWSYDKAYRELEALVNAGLVDQIRGFAPRGEGSVPTTYVINGSGATFLAEHGRDRDELQRVAKNLGVYRRAIEDNRPTMERHRMYSAMLLALLIASARSVDPEATVTDVRFDRERIIPVDLTPFAETITARDRSLITPDPAKTTVTYVPDFSYTVRWRIDGKVRTEPVFGEVETGYGERDARDLATGKAWKLRGLMQVFQKPFTMGGQTFLAGTMPRVVVWSRTPALEQRFFEGAAAVFRDQKSPLWLTNGEVLPLSIPTGTKKKGIAGELDRLVCAVQQQVWRWLRFADPNDRRRFVGIKKTP